jgi:hypothetical protein
MAAYVGPVTPSRVGVYHPTSRIRLSLSAVPVLANLKIFKSEVNTMRRLLSSGLAIVAGMVSVAAPVTHSIRAKQPAKEEPETSAYRNDPRLTCLQKFFGQSSCPAEKYSPVFLLAADANQLDWRLLPSISFVESTGGKRALNNNFFGWDCGRAVFTSPIAAIHEVAYQLRHSRIYRHKKLEAILHTYNPNADYARLVISVMRTIAPTETLE